MPRDSRHSCRPRDTPSVKFSTNVGTNSAVCPVGPLAHCTHYSYHPRHHATIYTQYKLAGVLTLLLGVIGAGMEKRFLRDAADEALDAAVSSGPTLHLLALLNAHTRHRRPSAASKAAVLQERCLGNLRVGTVVNGGLQGDAASIDTMLLIRSLKWGLEGREQAGRDAARKSCRRLQRAVGATRFGELVDQSLEKDTSGKLTIQKAAGTVGGWEGG